MVRFQLKNCPKCDGIPRLFGSGMANVVYKEDLHENEMYFVDFDGYFVKCEECGSCTGVYRDVHKAIHEWND